MKLHYKPKPSNVSAGEHGFAGIVSTHVYQVEFDDCSNLAQYNEFNNVNEEEHETTFAYDAEDRPIAVRYGSDSRKTTTDVLAFK